MDIKQCFQLLSIMANSLASFALANSPFSHSFPTMCPAPSVKEQVYQCYSKNFFFSLFQLYNVLTSFPFEYFFSHLKNLIFFLAFNLFSSRRSNQTSIIVSRTYTIISKEKYLIVSLIALKPHLDSPEASVQVSVQNFLKTQAV